MNIPPLNLIEIFEQSVTLSPDQIAIKGENFSFTYREFNILTQNFAYQLLRSGVGKGSITGICMNRSAEMLIGIFGILRAGAAYLPLDPGNPQKRIESLVKDAGVQLIVTSGDYIEMVQSIGCQFLIPGTENPETKDISLLPQPDAHDLAYILFTSGSTGTPKGVMIEHHSVVNLIKFIQNRYPLQQGDTVLFKSPYTFDGSIWELFGWMLMGGTLYIAPTGAEKDPRKLLQIIRKEKISFLFFVPSMLQAFLNFFPEKFKPEDTESLRWISVGGEVLPVQLVKNFYEKTGNKHIGLINVYGPTETTVYATTYLCGVDENVAKIPIGDAVENDFIYILNEDGEQLSDGEEGEIYIGGAGVARGYLNNPELTQERFLTDTFSGKGLMYKTGDTGKRNVDGTYDFTGRKDFQIKLRGQRIECGEIEHALLQTGFVRECVVQVDRDHSGDSCLVAWIITEKDTPLIPDIRFQSANPKLTAQIKTAISEWLPVFMLPSYYIVCKEFELTPHGKTDRKSLPALTEILPLEENFSSQPETETEKFIYDLWIRVLGKTSIGIDDDFFESGGHSLKAVQLISLMMKDKQVEIPLSSFYDGITIRQMAAQSDIGNYPFIQLAEPEKINIDPEQGFPITPVQTEMWIMNNFDVTGLTHNIQIEFTARGNVNIEQLKKTFTDTIREENIFRSVFKPTDGIPLQFIQKDIDVSIQFSDLRNPDEKIKQQLYEKICFSNGNVVFSTDKLPLFSLHLVQLQNDEYRMLMAVHHLIFDGWSLSLFMDKILKKYNNIPVSATVYTNADYVQFLNSSFNKEKAAGELQFWKNKLQKLPERWKLPKRNNFNADEAGKYGDRYWWHTEKKLTDDVEKFALENRTTPFVVFMTAFQLSLAAYDGNKDLIVGTPFANRNNEIVNQLIGYYTNMVSIRLKWNDHSNLQSIIAQCSNNAVDAFSHALVPFGDIAKAVGRKSDLATNPVFQAIFVMQNWPHDFQQGVDFSFHQKEIGNKTAKTDLLLNVETVDNQYTCWLEYDTMLYELSIVKKLADAISFSLREIINNPQMEVLQLTNQLQKILLPENRKTCYIAGEGKLAAQCATILSNKGFHIVAVISDDTWLKQHIQAPFKTSAQFKAEEKGLQEVDYIFSINNSIILKTDFLSNAREKSFNYHDSPLPAYAGMYATNWAILENQSTHGISWHEITSEIDAGDIYASEKLEIYPEDTVLTLNTRCFEAALKSFDQLTTEILTGNLKPMKQDLSKRTYYPLAKRPDMFGFLRPSMTIQQADCLIKATDFGSNFINEFALPWMLINEEYYIVGSAEVYALYQGKPGTYDIKDDIPGFYCTGGFIALNTLYRSSGEIVKIADVFSKTDRMSEPDPELCFHATDLYKKIAVHEPLLAREMKKISYISWPYQTFDYQTTKTIHREIKMADFQNNIIITEGKTDFLIAVCSLLLLRLSGENSGTISFIPARKFTHIPEFFCDQLPLNIENTHTESGIETFPTLLNQIKKLRKAQSYIRTLPVRYPDLRKNISVLPEICIIEGNDTGFYQPDMINIHISEEIITITGEQQSGKNLEDFLRCLDIYITELGNNPTINHEKINLREIHEIEISTNQKKEIENQDVLKRFFEMVEYYPDKTAIVDNNIEYTYKQLAEDVWRISSVMTPYLNSNEQFVAISMGRSYYNIVSILATLHVGAAFVPLDPELPAQRRDFILQDSGCSIILTDKVDSVSESFPKQINVADTAKHNTYSDKLYQTIHPDRAAYIIYTSGSTGQPKAVVLSRNNLATFITGALEIYQINSSDKVLQFSSLSFDACIEEIFCALCSGAGLYLRNSDMLDPHQFMLFSVENKITVWDLPTAYWRQLISTEVYLTELPHLNLRMVIIGGEVVYPADVKLWQVNLPGHRLINTYGPTETTVVALTYSVEPKAYKAVPIGVTLPGYFALIVDKNNLPVPEGIAGELLIFGDAVARNYLNRPEENSKAFIEIDLPGTGIHKCYRTGDIVSRDTDGLIYYLGRKDKQVKIRGFRVEIQEIEHQLMLTDDIKSCTVLVQEEPVGNKKLIAFCQSYDKAPDFNLIKENLSKVLPLWMIPQEFIPVEEIPLTGNGKVDQKTLLEIASGFVRKSNKQLEKPSTKTEEILYKLWQKILAVEEFCIDDDFFDLGGHSLKAVALMAELKKQTGQIIPLASLIQHGTIRKFAKYLDSKTVIHHWNCLVPVRTEGKKPPLFLVHGAGLNILLFQSLVKHLDPDRPIYAFQAAGLDGSKPLNNNIEAMAEEYISELLKIQPQGPYHVLGFSLGGFVAYEMAYKLKANGHLIGFTGLIDSVAFMADYSDSVFRKILINSWSLLIKPFFNIMLIIKEPAISRKRLIRKKYKNLRLAVRYILSKFGIVNTSLLHRDVEQSSFLTDKVMIIMNDALKKYKVKKADIQIDLFKAGKSTFYIYEPENYGWSEFALKGITKHIIPAEHVSLFAPPNDKLFAEITDQRLIETEALIIKK